MGTMSATTEITTWNANATSRIVRFNNGVRAVAVNNDRSGTSIFTSTDGIAWTFHSTYVTRASDALLDLFADQDDNLHLIVCAGGNIYVFSALLNTPGSDPVSGARTVLTQTGPQPVTNSAPPRIFAHRTTPGNTTDGWTVHYFYVYQVIRGNGTVYYNPAHQALSVKSSGYVGANSYYPLSGNPSQNWFDDVSGWTAEMQSISDGKTPPSGGPRMFFAITGTPGGANRTALFIAAGAFTANSTAGQVGSWAWATGQDGSGSTSYFTGMDMVWAGSRGLFAFTQQLSDGSGGTTFYNTVWEISATGAVTAGVYSSSYNNRTTAGSGAYATTINGPISLAVDSAGIVYLFGAPVEDNSLVFVQVNPYVLIQRYTLPSGAQSQGQPRLRRLGTFGGIDLLSQRFYSGGTWRTAVARYTTNAAPTAATPTTPTIGSSVDRTTPITLAWVFSDPDAGDSQSKADIRYKLTSASTWTTILGATTTATSYALAANQAAGNYEWQVLTYDALGVASPWSSSSFFIAADPPGVPVITAPANGATIATASHTVTWSSPQQDAYEVRRVADNAGSPNTSTVYFTTGTVEDATSRARTLSFDTNNRTEHVQVRVRYSGIWSQWATARVLVSYTPPATPTVVLTVQDATASILVTITNPTPSGSQPAVASHDILIDDGLGDGLTRRATGWPASAPFTYWLSRSGRDYAGNIKVVAVATNGTTSTATAT